MAKAIVCIGSTQMVGSNATISYSVTVLGPPNYNYGADYQVNTAITVNNNLLAWRNRVIAQAAEQGVTLQTTDVIVFGAPS